MRLYKKYIQNIQFSRIESVYFDNDVETYTNSDITISSATDL